MRDILEAVRDNAIKSGVQFMDVRLFNSLSSNVTIQDKKADKIGQNIRYGAGIRVLVEGAWGFASTNIINKQTLFVALENAIKMATLSKKKIDSPGVITKLDPIEDIHVSKVKRDPRRVPAKEKLDLITKFEARALDYGKSKIVNSIVQYMDYVIKETICNTVGTYIENETTRTFIAAVMTAQEGNVRQIAYKIRGGLSGFEFAETIDPDDLSVKAAKTAISLLKAELPPAGKFPVIFHPSVTGLFVHEAFGHNAEGDLIHGGESILEGKLGQTIGSEIITIIDDATLPGAYGSYMYDSEGTPGKKRILVENGVLKGFMHNLETAKKSGVEPNGSGRAMNHQHRPIVRMSNTFFKPGTSTFENMLKDIDKGVYVKGGQGGYVMVARGQYTCFINEAWMIRKGELAEHLRNVAVSGLTLETLKNIDAVSNDFEIDLAGMCGKNRQGMFVDGGGPFIRVKEVVVGGQK